jgi:hypothetical protein
MESSRISFEPSEDIRQGNGSSTMLHRDASAASVNQERVLYEAWRVSALSIQHNLIIKTRFL